MLKSWKPNESFLGTVHCLICWGNFFLLKKYALQTRERRCKEHSRIIINLNRLQITCGLSIRTISQSLTVTITSPARTPLSQAGPFSTTSFRIKWRPWFLLGRKKCLVRAECVNRGKEGTCKCKSDSHPTSPLSILSSGTHGSPPWPQLSA